MLTIIFQPETVLSNIGMNPTYENIKINNLYWATIQEDVIIISLVQKCGVIKPKKNKTYHLAEG